MSTFKSVNIRLSAEEVQQLERFQGLLQHYYGSSIKVTQRTVIIQAFEQLANHLKAQNILPQDDAQGR